ncbi:MAG TPA: polysaccharide deacetylase family protein [Solirubrobacterales bacterium]|jgi:peptidoglycan/xylan/chitin deacetylase (PgdA/CDA1 family)|nr:polysaccharide deacetylase family protein [Solirubrobacterales bacterium]
MVELDSGRAAQARACAAPGTVALTFDDGPDHVWTARILAALEHRAATATFFVDARRALACPKLVRGMVAAGHEVGLHCVRHVRHSELSAEEVAAEAAEGLEVLDSLGVRPTAWRTPWGVVTDATRGVAAERGLELWDWSFDSHDWRGDDCEEMLFALRTQGGLADGSVVLMHDALGPGARRDGCDETVRLTVALLDAAATVGLRPTRLSELAPVPT